MSIWTMSGPCKQVCNLQLHLTEPSRDTDWTMCNDLCRFCFHASVYVAAQHSWSLGRHLPLKADRVSVVASMSCDVPIRHWKP